MLTVNAQTAPTAARHPICPKSPGPRAPERKVSVAAARAQPVAVAQHLGRRRPATPTPAGRTLLWRRRKATCLRGTLQATPKPPGSGSGGCRAVVPLLRRPLQGAQHTLAQSLMAARCGGAGKPPACGCPCEPQSCPGAGSHGCHAAVLLETAQLQRPPLMALEVVQCGQASQACMQIKI